MLWRALIGESIVIYGNGSQTRDYVYIDDVVDALVAASTLPGLDRSVINVGSGVETSVNELIDAVGAAIGRSLVPLHVRAEDGGVSRMQASLTLAGQKLNFQPKVSLAEGLRRTLATDPRFTRKANLHA